MRDGYLRKMKGVFISHEASRRYSNGRTLTPMHPLKYVPSRTVYDALVTWTVKQIVQLFIKRYAEDVTAMQ
jgi:hypothetical protein